ncbi:hypothetical protein L1N85_07045 [Paenibacillus alkaliterrae]|uniref:hypothetical protein n=1 Tax=Paenibacillus alkaliterrae TaxID=320909 RepID=UPI001F3767F6|nr:hypothetical protein [Paenibacillus alkaliterrae]MCF2938190.1 hypothetical protein [Paenibacillus alkaliterrae]
MNRRLADLFAYGDTLFGGFFPWLEEQYDGRSGGFFYARSSKQSGRFTPDIESTAQAFNIIERCGLLGRLSDPVKEDAIRFFQSKQDESTGLFYDTNPNMRLDDVMVGRAAGYSFGALRKFGVKPLYPLPHQSKATPAYMESLQTFGSWLRSISLVNSWRGCDKLSHCGTHLAALPADEREPYQREVFDYLNRNQNPKTGFWGEGTPYVQLSGTFKTLLFYNRFGVPIPRKEQIYNSILRVLRTETAFDMCYIRNPISLLSAMKLSIPPGEMTEIADITLANMAKLKREDGGFSRELQHSPPAPNVAQVKPGEEYPDMPIAVPLGLGLVEGDMNAGTQVVLIRYTLRELAELPLEHLPVPESWFGGEAGAAQ